MKSKTALSLAFVLGAVILSLVSFAAKVGAQPGKVFLADSGMVTLGPNQILRMTASNGLDQATVRFRRLDYDTGSCVAGVCKHIISSEAPSGPITLAPGVAASYPYNEGDTASHVRGLVTANRKDVKVLFQVINVATGEIVTAWYTCSGGTCETQ